MENNGPEEASIKSRQKIFFSGSPKRNGPIADTAISRKMGRVTDDMEVLSHIVPNAHDNRLISRSCLRVASHWRCASKSSSQALYWLSV